MDPMLQSGSDCGSQPIDFGTAEIVQLGSMFSTSFRAPGLRLCELQTSHWRVVRWCQKGAAGLLLANTLLDSPVLEHLFPGECIRFP
jgi:hypothetical protein